MSKPEFQVSKTNLKNKLRQSNVQNNNNNNKEEEKHDILFKTA